MTYAQAWNQSWRGALPEGPVFIEVSGLYDEDEEMYAKMDVEEDVEINATALRAVLHGLKQERDSNWRIAMAEPDASSRELDETMAMDIDFQTWGDGQPSYLVLDTNVLLSYLDLLASFASHFGKMDASPVLFFVPAVVLQELDGLKKDDGKLGMLARKANQWLLEEARQKNRTGRGIVRGQHQGMMFRGQTRKGRYDERSNDDIILESCVFLAATHRLPPGKVVLLSADRNLCAKCELEGLHSVTLADGWSRTKLIQAVLPGYRDPSSTVTVAQSQLAASGPVTRMDDITMDVDLSEGPHAPRVVMPQHPLEQLYDRLIEQLRALAEEAVQAERIRIEGELGSAASIHSRSARSRFGSAPLPVGDEWIQGSPRDWLPLLASFPLPGMPAAPRTRAKAKGAPPSLLSFLTPPGQPGGRRARDWSRGDWLRAVSELADYVPSRDLGFIRQDVESTFATLFT